MPSDNKATFKKTPSRASSGPLYRNTTILNFGRLFIASLILDTSLLIPEHGKRVLQIPSNTQLFILISIVYFYSLICILLIKHFKNSQGFVFSQILADTIFITAFVHISGGAESIFIFLYFFSVITGGLFLKREKLFLIVFIASLLYIGSILKTAPINALLQSNITPYIWANRFLIYKIGINIIALWGVAILTSVLSLELQKRRKELVEKTKEYKKLEQFSKNIIQSIESGILTIDNNNRVTYINKAGENILEIDRSMVDGRNLGDVFPALSEYLSSKAMPRDRTRHINITYRRPGSRNKVIGFSVSTLLDSVNHPSGKIIIFQDLTRYKVMEKRIHESEKLATVGRFAAGLAHEIRNPLTSLSGSIQVLKNSLNLKETEKELMDIVLRETNRLNRLVSDFLQFSQFRKENLQRLKLRPLIEEIISIIAKENQVNGIRFVNELPEDLVIDSDRDKLKQVFWNILINAVQAKEKEALIVTIKGSRLSRDDAEAPDASFYTITIQDNGKGIPKPAIKKIFEPFFTTRSEGTGLGLSIAYQILNSLGGDISVASKEGLGTKIKINLPA